MIRPASTNAYMIHPQQNLADTWLSTAPSTEETGIGFHANYHRHTILSLCGGLCFLKGPRGGHIVKHGVDWIGLDL